MTILPSNLFWLLMLVTVGACGAALWTRWVGWEWIGAGAFVAAYLHVAWLSRRRQ